MILCISHSRDYYTIDRVAQHLQQSGEKVFRLNSDFFSYRSRFHFSLNGSDGSLVVHTPDGTFDTREVKAVWYRKLWKTETPEGLDPAFIPVYHQEYTTMRDVLFHALRNVPWINPIGQDHLIASDKYWQLSEAAACGLVIPESLFSNDAAEVNAFFHTTCKGQMIAKLHGTLSRSMSGNAAFFPTTLITEKDLSHLDELTYCPMIFQRAIPKAYELRVIYINGHFFSGRIDAQASVKGSTDWRIANDVQLSWEHYELPKEIAQPLTELMLRLRLSFGAIDIIREENGQYVFLEVNPQGEWGMLERDLHYPISENIARCLSECAAGKTLLTQNQQPSTILPVTP